MFDVRHGSDCSEDRSARDHPVPHPAHVRHALLERVELPALGVRESRRIVGDYTLTFDDQIREAANLLNRSELADWIRYKLDRRFDRPGERVEYRQRDALRRQRNIDPPGQGLDGKRRSGNSGRISNCTTLLQP